MQVPWAKLGREPVVVEFDKLYILAVRKEESAKVKAGDAKSSQDVAGYEAEMERMEQEAKRKKVASAELAWLQGLAAGAEASSSPLQQQESRKSSTSSFQAMLEPILGNLELRFSNIHIRYEEEEEEGDADKAGLEAQKSEERAGGRGTAAEKRGVAVGVMLKEVSAHTIDEWGMRRFVTNDVLQCLRKVRATKGRGAKYSACLALNHILVHPHRP